MFVSHFVCSNCSPSTFIHIFSHSLTQLLGEIRSTSVPIAYCNAFVMMCVCVCVCVFVFEWLSVCLFVGLLTW